MRTPNWRIVEENDECITIEDMGPWSVFPTITNGAEHVVAALAERVGNRRLFYYDSDGRLDELVIRNGRFAGFAPGPAKPV